MRRDSLYDIEIFEDDAIDGCMEIFTNNQEIFEERKKNYINQGLKYYSGAKFIKLETYKEIKRDFENGNEKALMRLIEESTGDIIRVVARVCAKYNVEEYVSFDEALSFTLEKLCSYITKYKFLPVLRGKYINNVTVRSLQSNM